MHLIDESEKRVFYFILSENFNVISINENLGKFYSIDYAVLNRLNSDILSFFEISPSSITNQFITKLKHLRALGEVKNFFNIFNNIYNLKLEWDENEIYRKQATNTMNTRPKRSKAEIDSTINSRIKTQ